MSWSYCPASESVANRSYHPFVKKIGSNFVAAVAEDRQGVYLTVIGPNAEQMCRQYASWFNNQIEADEDFESPDEPHLLPCFIERVVIEVWADYV